MHNSKLGEVVALPYVLNRQVVIHSHNKITPRLIDMHFFSTVCRLKMDREGDKKHNKYVSFQWTCFFPSGMV